MVANLQQNTNNSVRAGEILFFEGQQARSLALLLQGRLSVFLSPLSDSGGVKSEEILNRSFRLYDLEQNIFIGGDGILLYGAHTLSFKAGADCSVYACEAGTAGQLMSLISARKDYGAYIINSICTLIDNSYSALKKAEGIKKSLENSLQNLTVFFWALKEKHGFEYTPASDFIREGLDNLGRLREKGYQVPLSFSSHFVEGSLYSQPSLEALEDESLDLDSISYYVNLTGLPAEIRKSFFSSDSNVAFYNIKEASKCLDSILDKIRETFCDIRDYHSRLYSEEGESLYSLFCKTALEVGAAGNLENPAVEALEYILEKLRELALVYQADYCHNCETDLEYIEHSFNNIKASLPSCQVNAASGAGTDERAGRGYDSLPEELKDSAVKIIEYSGIPKERADLFLMNLVAFRNLRDKLSADEAAKNIRSSAASVFFEIYEAVFRKYMEQLQESRLINMFLCFGYMDEKLLSVDETMTLYRLAGKWSVPGRAAVQPAVGSQASVHYMKDWLFSIYTMEKEPSINEFEQDYSDVFRELKRTGHASDRDKAKYDQDRGAKLAFEISNMLRNNHKVCHGQINVYFPVLFSGMITRDLARSFVTEEKIHNALSRILEADFSAFHRELHFRDQEKGIEKELVMKQVMPDIILIPIYGSRSMMWQEISGRDRSTPARFLLPVFTDEDIYETLTRLVGNFRWELCRTMMGAAWNDVTQSSLTSEYTDYIQFFKKNRDLSEEVKNRIKLQIVKYHNKVRDIFTSDYDTWINSEAKGNIRLNKVVRSILYRHCPLSKPIREQFDKQPVYQDICAQFRNQRLKLAKELESRYSRYEKSFGELNPELRDNLVFYRDL